MKFIITGLFLALALAACELPQERLVCRVGDTEVFRSAPSEAIYKAERNDAWSITGQGTYTPPANSMCSRQRVS